MYHYLNVRPLHNAAAKSYRDVVYAVCGNPGVTFVAAPARNLLHESSIVTGEIPSDGDFLTVVRKKRISPSPVNTEVSPVPQRHPGFP
jgi:hypothetical protein